MNRRRFLALAGVAAGSAALAACGSLSSEDATTLTRAKTAFAPTEDPAVKNAVSTIAKATENAGGPTATRASTATRVTEGSPTAVNTRAATSTGTSATAEAGTKAATVDTKNQAPKATNAELTPDVPTTSDQAAAKYGLSDYAKQPGSWVRYDFNKDQNTGKIQTYGWAMKDDSTGEHHRLNVVKTVVDGSIEVKSDKAVPFYQAGKRRIGLVINGNAVPETDMRGGTLYSGKDVSPSKSYRQQVDKENGPIDKGGQPGTISHRVGFNDKCLGNVTAPEVTTREQAAIKFGSGENASAYTQDPAHWHVTARGNGMYEVHLDADPSGEAHRIQNLQGTVYSGSWDIKSDDEVKTNTPHQRPIGFVGDGSVEDKVDTRGMTIWVYSGKTLSVDDQIKLLKDTWNDTKNNEAKPADQGGQPGILLLPLGFDPGTYACTVYQN